MNAIVADRACCPHAAGRSHAAERGLAPDAWLAFPQRRAAMLQDAVGEGGAPELRLYVGVHEIAFDDPAFFPFAEQLSRSDRFQAADAMAWGEGYAWGEVAPMLADLAEAGILAPAEHDAPLKLKAGLQPSPLPPAPSPQARSWNELPGLMTELAGRPLELGWLEMAIPVFRVAHAALDADGRQVGEANVFPPALRIDVPTRWRTCLYAGTRHQPDRPMNVEALRAMQAHWGQMMGALARIRAGYLRRFPEAFQGGWTIGALERLAVCVLAVPTYAIMKPGAAATPLHPVLSSIFRVTDGLRMVMHQMLFVPIGEPARSPYDRVSAADIHAYAERNYSFHSETGVCAGPPHMVAEFLDVLVSGREPDAIVFASEVEAALADVEAAMDYGLEGLRVHAAAFSIWPAMSRAYMALHAALEASQRPEAALTARFAAHLETLRRSTYLWDEAHLAQRDAVYDDMWATCTRGLGDASEPLSALLARPLPGAERLRTDLTALIGGELAGPVMAFAATVSAAIAAAATAQQRLNARLQRPAPQRPFDSDDANLHVRLQRPAEGRLPYLFDELRDALGLDLTVTADGARAQASHPIRRLDRPDSEGLRPRSNSTGEIP